MNVDIDGTPPDQPTGGELQKYADKAMFDAAPIIDVHRVVLLSMSADPLGEIASFWRMYQGVPTFDLADITNGERAAAWADMQRTHLKAPLEAVKVHFFIEGVDRSFTHQIVRQRTAVYAQESLRFAVKTAGQPLREICPYPPSFSDGRVMPNLSAANDAKAKWDHAIDTIDEAVQYLVANGVPNEDARGLYPHAILTRLHYVTDLRNLLEHAGNRLCTQAQFHWRKVFQGIRDQIRDYQPVIPDVGGTYVTSDEHRWQYELIANEGFVPQCYLQGKCTFDSKIDRGCTIRPRVDAFAAAGVPSTEWENETISEEHRIDRSEWLEDPQAAWIS